MRHFKILCFLFVITLFNTVLAGDLEKADSLFDERKYAKALQIYLKPELQNDAYIQNQIGWIYRNAKDIQDIEKSYEWYKKAADQGYADAQYNLAVAYLNGLGTHQNHEKAMDLFQKAAKQNLPAAFTGIGLMYDRGLYVKPGKTEAAEWFLKAANKGETAAMCNLSYMLIFGEGVHQDYTQARIMLSLCLKRNNQNDCCLSRMSDLYRYGWGVKQDHATANEYQQKAAALGSGLAMFNLGTAYDYGFGVEKNAQTALDWYDKGAAAGDARSMYRLYEVYEYGKLDQPVDKAKASEWKARAEKTMEEQGLSRNELKDRFRLLVED